MNNTWIQFYTIIRKQVIRFMRIWSQTLLPPAITQSLYFIIFGGFVGSRIDNIAGVKYMQFIVPGLVMMAVINASYSNAVSSFFQAKFQKNIEELLVSPTPNWVIIAGFTFGSVLRGLLVGMIVFAISIFFASPKVDNIFIIALFILLTAIVFSLGGLVNGIFATKFDDVSIFPTFILTPLTYLAGVFYSIKDLPPFWQEVSKLNPILYMVNGFRYGFFGPESTDVNVLFSLFILVYTTILLSGISWFFLNKGWGIRN